MDCSGKCTSGITSGLPQRLYLYVNTQTAAETQETDVAHLGDFYSQTVEDVLRCPRRRQGMNFRMVVYERLCCVRRCALLLQLLLLHVLLDTSSMVKVTSKSVYSPKTLL